MIGRVESLERDASGGWFVTGWTCYRGDTSALRVDVYAGPFVVQAHEIAIGKADQASDARVAQMCQSGASGHRYRVRLPASLQQDDGGQGVYVFGISPTGKGDLQLDGSGVIVPQASSTGAMTIAAADGPVIGRVESLVEKEDGSGRWVVSGWTCYRGYSNPLRVDIYTGASVPKDEIASVMADRQSDAGQARTCQTGGSAYRFQVTLPETLQQNAGGDKLYVFGISPAGKGDVLLEGSGITICPRYFADQLWRHSPRSRWNHRPICGK